MALQGASDAALRHVVARPRRCRGVAAVTRAAKKGKGSAGGGGAPRPGSGGGSGGSSSGGSSGGGKSFKSPGEETRKTILTMQKLTKTTPTGKQLLRNISLGIYLGAKIGILGANGAGKSTLLKILAGVDKTFDGELNVTKGLKVGYLAQEPALADGATVWDNIAPGLADVQARLSEFEHVSTAMGEPGADVDKLMARMDTLQSQLDAENGWELERTAARAMDALRCPPKEALVQYLSGGERRRVAICRLLLERPEMLLLDEPTNHHDNVAGWILELDRGAGIPFEGNYSQWLESKAKRLAGEGAQQSAREKAIAAEWEYVSQSRQGQRKTGKARLRAYDQLVADAAAFARAATLDAICIPAGPRLGSQVVEARGLRKGFAGRLLFDNLSFVVPPGAVVGIVGANGAGKSTLFKMIMGREQPDGGELVIGETVKPMCVDQSRDALDDAKTVLAEMCGAGVDEVAVAGRSIPARQYATWFAFRGADAAKTVGQLSGGERNRLLLAKTLLLGGNLLLLDEPSNDLDVDTLRALEDAIAAFVGSTLIVSHDRWLLDRVATHTLAFEGDSHVVWFDGSFSEYEADRRRRTGVADPTAIKFRPMPA